ncbi:membrane protein [Fulvitalea axinellae]|uniref:Membrane protein n=1 Tax=Fulvitalea axinellae TaxID=1182444 RepID=A0AAU9D7Q5_9BACT|nr:membrane protein [Fulvitalea axinellae]
METNFNRDDIHLVARHSDWSESEVSKALEKDVYAGAGRWVTFFRLLFVGLGVGLSVAGVVFFFAYNWEALDKFVKMSLVGGLLVAVTGVALFAKINPLIKKILLTAAAVLVGVLFAVFGQIYQTGANAYDFFLAWTVFVVLWVLVSDFAPLWFLFVVLVNTTIALYMTQNLPYNSPWNDYLKAVIFVVNALGATLSVVLREVKKYRVPGWFSNTFSIYSVFLATAGLVDYVFKKSVDPVALLSLALPVAFFYVLAIVYSLKKKLRIYIALIALSLIVIISYLLVKDSGFSAEVFLLVSVFIVAAVGGVIALLMKLQKKWADDGE